VVLPWGRGVDVPQAQGAGRQWGLAVTGWYLHTAALNSNLQGSGTVVSLPAGLWVSLLCKMQLFRML